MLKNNIAFRVGNIGLYFSSLRIISLLVEIWKKKGSSLKIEML
jgi:hypothetical protein